MRFHMPLRAGFISLAMATIHPATASILEVALEEHQGAPDAALIDAHTPILKELLRREIALYDEYEAIELTRQQLPTQLREWVSDRGAARLGARFGRKGGIDGVYDDGPAAQAGLQAGDRVLAVNGVRTSEDLADQAAVALEYRRLTPGQMVDLTVVRDGEERLVSVGTITQREERRLRYRRHFAPEDPQLVRQQEIESRTRHRYFDFKNRDLLTHWDGMMLVSHLPGLEALVGERAGVFVMEVEDKDHPLKAGDYLLTIDKQTPADAYHAARLLFDCEPVGSIRLSVEREGAVVELEMPYPDQEKLIMDL